MPRRPRSHSPVVLVLTSSFFGAGCDTASSPPGVGLADAASSGSATGDGDETTRADTSHGSTLEGTETSEGSTTRGDGDTWLGADTPAGSDTREGPASTTLAGASDGGTLPTTDGGGGAACEFVVSKNEVSAKMPTVGVVEWSLAGEPPTSAKILFELVGATPTQVNTGGEAPVDPSKPNHRTLLLGLKQESDYQFRIEAVQGDRTCMSDVWALPTTGTLPGAPREVAVTIEQPGARTPGFILAPAGYGGQGASVLDADGAVVWYVAGPADPGRMHLDYEGENMWIMSLNPVVGLSGRLQFVSMDGQTGGEVVEGLEKAHHDFVMMPGGKLATMVFRIDFDNGVSGDPSFTQPESDLVVRAPDGTLTTAFKIGSNLYASENYYHANALHYIPEDNSFTISDKNADLIVKVSAAGQVEWQLGGRCANAPAGAGKCVEGTWLDNHGHHWLPDGTFLLFNNYIAEEVDSEQVEHSRILEFDLTVAAESMTAVPTKQYTGTHLSGILGDVQRLPNGHTLITYSSSGKIVEVDAEWNVVQTLTNGSFGYAEWRPTLYGPPVRL